MHKILSNVGVTIGGFRSVWSHFESKGVNAEIWLHASLIESMCQNRERIPKRSDHCSQGVFFCLYVKLQKQTAPKLSLSN